MKKQIQSLDHMTPDNRPQDLRKEMNIINWLRIVPLLALTLLFGVTASWPRAVNASTPTYNSVVYGNATIRYVKVDLNDSQTIAYPITAYRVAPLRDSVNWEPRWDVNGNNIDNGTFDNRRQDLLQMYDGADGFDAQKYAAINTDYFCRSGCYNSGERVQGDAGAPQGLVVHFGTVYHQGPKTGPRAALTFDSTYRASIRTHRWGESTSGIYQAVGGGPIILQGSRETCNPEGSDLGYRCGTTTTYRSGACITSDGRTLFLVATSTTTTWSNFATFMKNSLGCSDGMQFDGGSSAGLVYQGSYKVSPATVGSGLMIGYKP